jgi:hypothetical protein
MSVGQMYRGIFVTDVICNMDGTTGTYFTSLKTVRMLQ